MDRRASSRAVLVALAAAGAQGCSKEPAVRSIEPVVVTGGEFVYVAIETDGFDDGPVTITLERIRDLDGNQAGGSTLTTVVERGGPSIQAGFDFDETVPLGVYSLRLVPARGTGATVPDGIVVVGREVVTGPEPGAVCLATPSPRVAVLGTGFAAVDGVSASVVLHDSMYGSWPLTARPGECRQVPFSRKDVRLCSRLEMPLPALPTGGYSLEMTQIGSRVPLEVPVLLVHPPALRTWDESEPFATADGPAEVPVEPAGGNWWDAGLRSAASPPQATLDGLPVAVTAANCQPTWVAGLEICELSVVAPQGTAPGRHDIAITMTPGCGASTSFVVLARPSLAGVTPAAVCARSWDTLEITGSGFFAWPRVFLDGDQVGLARGCGSPPYQVCDAIAVHPYYFSPLPPGPRLLTVEVETRPPMRALEALPVTLLSGPPRIVGPTPTTVYGGSAREVFVGLPEPVTAITAAFLDPEQAGLVPVPATATPVAGGAMVAVPPAAAGPYSVALTEGGQCTGRSDGVLWVVADFVALSSTFEFSVAGFVIGWPDSAFEAPPTVTQTGGNPGWALAYAGDGARPPPWYFVHRMLSGYDVGGVFFDLRLAAPGSGAPIVAPDVILSSSGASLERSLAPPPGTAWTSYALDLDDPTGWTYRDATGARPATQADVIAISWGFALWIRGQYAEGPTETWLDNYRVELRH
jgi:hypothetical protein